MGVRLTHRRKPSRARERAKALFRDSILDAAETVFAESGFSGARIQDIAKGAGVGVGTVYNHFETKDDVLRALLDERSERLVSLLAPASDDPGAFRPRLEKRMHRLLTYLDSHRGFLRILFSLGMVHDCGAAPERAAIKARLERFRKAFRTIAEEGIEAGALRANVDPGDLAALLAGTFRAMTLRAILENERDLPARAPLIAGFFLDGAGK